MSQSIESFIEGTALVWLGQLGYAVLNGPEIFPERVFLKEPVHQR